MNNIRLKNNTRKLQQQILLKYKLKQNEMILIQNQLKETNIPKQNEPDCVENIQPLNDLVTVTENVLTDDNSKKLALIKSKIMTDYSNLYKTK